jgi:hypothetical protein
VLQVTDELSVGAYPQIKYAALFTLVFQNTTLILMMKQVSQPYDLAGANMSNPPYPEADGNRGA